MISNYGLEAASSTGPIQTVDPDQSVSRCIHSNLKAVTISENLAMQNSNKPHAEFSFYSLEENKA